MNKTTEIFNFTENNNSIFNDDGVIIAVIPESTTRNERRVLEYSGEMFQTISSFVDQINTVGVFRPKAIAKRFEELIKKIDVK